ncbi:hypothetical protein H0H93_009691 [Arthromyces matolae]|nr:hypothetical protein H0H93_009691 [Arthromyces matolae]
MACSYLLSLEDRSSPPKLQRSYTAKEWARLRADEVMTIVPDDPSAISNNATNVIAEGVSSFSAASKGNHPESLNTILDLHSSRRMKRPSSPSKKAKHGVSIPSQRRWLYYWALLLSHTAPQHVWPILPTPSPKVQLTQMKLRMRPVSSTTASLARAASVVLERAKGAKNAPEHKNAHVWASLARYDDGLNDVLEEWERRTRDKFGRLGIRDPGSENINDENIRDLFRDERWDAEKMVKTFARMGAVGGASMVREKGEDRPRPGDEQIDVFTLSSLTVQKWETFRSSLEGEGKPNPDDFERLSSETESWDDVTQSSPKERGVVVDVGREIRIKLYKGQLFMGWFWFVPAFHMISSSEEPTKLLLARKEIDFPLGLGSAIIDVEIQMEWLSTE